MRIRVSTRDIVEITLESPLGTINSRLYAALLARSCSQRRSLFQFDRSNLQLKPDTCIRPLYGHHPLSALMLFKLNCSLFDINICAFVTSAYFNTLMGKSYNSQSTVMPLRAPSQQVHYYFVNHVKEGKVTTGSKNIYHDMCCRYIISMEFII